MNITEQRCSDFYAFMREREAIRLKREEGHPPPWTDDPILQKYKFTNVKREHDRTSRLLREEFYTPHKDDKKEMILLNCAIARYFGTIEMMRAVGWQKSWNPNKLIRVAADRRSSGERVYTTAYQLTTGGAPGVKAEIIVGNFLHNLWLQRKEIVAAAESGTMRLVLERLQQVHGFGGSGFMAKEVLNDTRYTDFWPLGAPTDKDTWCAVGPGSMRGAARLAGIYPGKVNKEATLDILRYAFSERRKYWSGVELELADIQFQACEADKYERVQAGEGRPRNRFYGGVI